MIERIVESRLFESRLFESRTAGSNIFMTFFVLPLLLIATAFSLEWEWLKMETRRIRGTQNGPIDRQTVRLLALGMPFYTVAVMVFLLISLPIFAFIRLWDYTMRVLRFGGGKG